MSLLGAKVGDRLVLRDRRGEREVTVTRVGRTYLYVDGSSSARFDRHSGRDGYGNERVLTRAMLAHEDALAWLRRVGVTIEWASPHRARAVDIANALRPVLEPETGEG